MAASLNRVLLIGNLTRDPELRFIPSGQGVTNFTVAVNRVYSSNTGERKEEVSYIRVVVWGKRAQSCHDYLKKGSPVFVEGRLQSRSWEASDGQKRSTIEVIAQDVQFLSRGGERRGESAAPVEEAFPEDIVEDSFDRSPRKKKNQEDEVTEEELRPDEDVPF